ncbi:MAG: hypothetical protein MAGBODY4_00431 [Candidatus Marinimicrobia bacterium]|nr:hypothetical protein [Candidatus Neomarinimicrobiota bacterium]
MKNFKKIVIGGLVGMSLIATACSSGPSEEQLNTLGETRQAAEAGEQQVKDLEKEKRSLQSELEAKQQELSRAQAEKARVEKAVSDSGEKGEGGMTE